MPNKEIFADYLKHNHPGPENAIKSKDLKPLFGTGEQIRAMVNALRCEGVPICSGPDGYYYARTREDVENTMAILYSRAFNIALACEGLAESLGSLPKGG